MPTNTSLIDYSPTHWQDFYSAWTSRLPLTLLLGLLWSTVILPKSKAIWAAGNEAYKTRWLLQTQEDESGYS